MRGDDPGTTELLTVGEAAQQTGLSRHTIRGWITSGHLPAVSIDRRLRVRPADLATTHADVGSVVAVWRQDRRRAGRRLRALREAAALTQLQVAAASGLSHEAISRLETGHSAASAKTVLQLAHALRVKPQRLVRREPVGVTMLTVVEAASRLDVPMRRVQTWLREGVLPGVKISGQWRVPMVVIVELIRSERLRGRSRRLDPRFRG